MPTIRYLFSPPDNGAARLVVTGHMHDRRDGQVRFPLANASLVWDALASLVDGLQRSRGLLHLFTSATQGVDRAFHLGRPLRAHPDRYLSAASGTGLFAAVGGLRACRDALAAALPGGEGSVVGQRA